jgi:hypothetical protein
LRRQLASGTDDHGRETWREVYPTQPPNEALSPETIAVLNRLTAEDRAAVLSDFTRLLTVAPPTRESASRRRRKDDRLVSLKEACEITGRKPATLYAWSHERRLEVQKQGRGRSARIFFWESDLRALLIARPALRRSLTNGA